MLPDFFDCPFSILQRLFNIVVYFFQRRQFGKRKSTREKKAQEYETQTRSVGEEIKTSVVLIYVVTDKNQTIIVYNSHEFLF
jgi:hypothetical protein